MFHRLINLSNAHSFFLFGARGCGKTTLLRQLYSEKDTYFIDLLDLEQEAKFIQAPETLAYLIDSLSSKYRRVVIDEIQKAPKLLDVIHQKIEQGKRKKKLLQFIMTGSSARKLKHGAANLLAGRAFVYNLFPLTCRELDKQFDLQKLLEYGSLPEIWNLKDRDSQNRYLEAYSRTYLKEEIWNEQIIRKMQPFANFLEIAAQMNGKILNYSKIAQEIAVDTKTVQSYFQILEDTLLGFFIPAYHRSVRKRQLTNPKFYFFDTGVKRALDHTLSAPLLKQTYAFGDAFEHFILLELVKMNEYRKLDLQFSYLKTHDGAEIDLIIERHGKPFALVEIKSAKRVMPQMTKHIETFSKDFGSSEAYLLSLDPTPQKIGPVLALHWQEGLQKILDSLS